MIIKMTPGDEQLGEWGRQSGHLAERMIYILIWTMEDCVILVRIA